MIALSGGGVVVEDSADPSPREGTSYGLELEHQRSLEMEGISGERPVDGNHYSAGRDWV
jgi:hypothetical protein